MSRSFRMRYRDVSETKMAFQTLATFTDIVQSNHRLRNATVLRLLNAKTLPRAVPLNIAFAQPTTFQPGNFLVEFPVFNQYIISSADKAK